MGKIFFISFDFYRTLTIEICFPAQNFFWFSQLSFLFCWILLCARLTFDSSAVHSVLWSLASHNGNGNGIDNKCNGYSHQSFTNGV